MGKTIILAEKPSVGRDIAKALKVRQLKNGYIESNQYIVTWAMGHLVSLADPEAYDKSYANWNLEVLPIIFEHPKFNILKSTSKQFKIVSNLLSRRDISRLVIATDAGREGELVARLIILKTNFKKEIKRLWISSVTPKAIQDGFANLEDGKKYENLYQSALARAESDWLIGINATRALTTKYNAQLSCGRVQTPTLQMIQIQDDKIKNFVAKKYYHLEVLVDEIVFKVINEQKSTQFFDLKQVEIMMEKIKKINRIKINEIKNKNKKIYPKELYDLTTLQKEANHLFGFSAKFTLDIIQSLYEYHKLVTYPRTDSKYLTTDMKTTLKERISASDIFGYEKIIQQIDYQKINYQNFVNNQKVSDHHAIIPTEIKANLIKLNNDEIKIYQLITKRFLSVFLKPLNYEQQQIIAKASEYKLEAKGQKIIDLGYNQVYKNLDEEEQLSQIANLKNNQEYEIKEIKIIEKLTNPPKAFNEGNLLLAMENPTKYIDNVAALKTLKQTGGIGTVATRADIIEKLFSTFVIEKNKNGQINITNKGRELLKVVPFDLKSPLLTAQLEEQLKEIEKGKLTKTKFLNQVKSFTKEIIIDIKNSEFEFTHDNLTNQKCPKCQNQMFYVSSKNAKMLVCSNLECKHRVNLAIDTKQKCPNCSKRLTLIGENFDKQALFCNGCGYRKSLNQIAKDALNSNSASKHEVKKLLKNQKKETTIYNPFSDMFKK